MVSMVGNNTLLPRATARNYMTVASGDMLTTYSIVASLSRWCAAPAYCTPPWNEELQWIRWNRSEMQQAAED